MQSTAPSIPAEAEPQELARFRAEWIAELQSRKAAAGKVTASAESTSAESPPGKGKTAAKSPGQTHPGSLTPTIAGIPPALATFTPSAHLAESSLPRKLASALSIYHRAVEHEQSGELDDALVLYRQAFRMDAHVDRIYHREEMLASIAEAQQQPIQTVTPVVPEASVEELATKVQHSLAVKPRDGAAAVRVTGTLATLIEKFPSDLSFQPEVEEEPVHLHKLADELLIMILRKLDPTSVERFASVSRKARILTLESALWRNFVKATYKPPQVPDIAVVTSALERCLFDYRRVYIEQPRVRLDGVYIATCHYVRAGLSENSWVNISHLITYHRYLRFFSNGQVLSLLANEEHPPQQIIPLLKPTLRMKGFYIGTWQLSGTTIYLSNLMDASGRFPLPTDEKPQAAAEPGDGARYTFGMTLSLASRPLGRWNKLHIEAYNSVNLETGDINPVALKHERPFWFSKVRSYSLY
ncbi:putative F-Box protein [Lyophyllum shimeji]|uniref:F-Box protein n=1 Tax=Lyophyllum shimeji TaxID=47721 RepID=A0A9P3PUT2_LYOSH|nr:putative F-Box protein [Lyophyllum shimeji]